MANQITVNSGSGNITVTTSRAVIGTVANVASANYANFAGEVVDASQPNITSVGNLTSLNVTGTTTTGNLVVLGNLQVGNLVANTANFANFAGEAFNVAGANVTGAVANATFAANAGFATTAGSANTANSATVANSANAVAGANVSGTVANATYALDAGNANFANSATVATSANSVTLANVSGAGNIASINLDGSTSNVLYGNGIFAPAAGGNTANANYANFAGNAFSVDGANVSGTVANATYALNAGNANIANIAYSVSGANVSGTVANATFALDAGNANIANIAYSVAAANVSGLGNIATINLDGNASNVLFGNGTFGPEGSTGNANYANFAGNSFSVDGGNVVGAVANANYAANAAFADNATFANYVGYAVENTSTSSHLVSFVAPGFTANKQVLINGNFIFNPASETLQVNQIDSNAALLRNIPGANVTGTVANANIANIANIAYSVDAANVSGIGNIATINLDGNVSNLLTGNGTFVAIPTDVANANYANFAGNVVTAAQPNITSLGNLVSLTINDGSSINTSVFEPTGATVNSNTYISVDQRDIANNSSDGIILANASAGTVYAVNYLPSTGNTIVTGPIMEVTVDDDIGVGNVAVPGGVTFSTYNSGSDLTTGDGNLRTSFGVSDGVTFFNGAPFAGNTALFSTFNYGFSSDLASSTLWRSTRRRGNGTTRLSLEPNDYLGNIEWRGARSGGGLPTGSRFAKIAPRVDSSYVANTNAQPVGIEFWVTDNTTARSQIFHANGNVTFTSVVNANLFSGNGSALTAITGANVTGTVADANYAAYAGNVITANQPNITSVGNLSSLNVTGNVNVGSGNIVLNSTGTIDYLRTFGSFTSNATQTSNGANTTNYMTLNNTEDANGISIASSTQITVARTGRYNIQFSAQVEKTDGGTDIIEIWLDKNGTAVANSATQLELQGSGAKAVAAWDFNVNAANINDYFRLAWASPDTAVQLTAIDTANTISGVAIPSVILDINPIGA